MPIRATKRGAQRTPIKADCDVLICGASFAGLAVAGALAGSGASVQVLDRYEIGERQTSACGIPTAWLQALQLQDCELQRFSQITMHTPYRTSRWSLPFSFSTFDYRQMCALLWEQTQLPDAAFETAAISGRSGNVVQTDRGPITARLIVDALGWRRVLAGGKPIQPPNARLSRGLEVHPAGQGDEMELWIDHRYVRSGYAWSFPAATELRVGAGSFRPADHVREPTVRLAGELGLRPEGFQGNWIPHKLRAAVEDRVYFVGDSAGHCLPLTAEGIRTALYFGIACGRQIRSVLEGGRSPEQALAAYGAFSESHRRKFEWMLRVQHLIGRLTPTPAVTAVTALTENRRFANWAFGHYFNIASPASIAADLPGGRLAQRPAAAALSS